MDFSIMDERAFSASKRLWTECFEGDDELFVNWYYNTRTCPQYALGAFNEGEADPIAMLHMLPMQMRFDGKAQRICFVAGVCTSPAYRHRGICTELFEHAFDVMVKRGFAASVLQPFNVGFYEKLGYKTFSFRDKFTVSDDWLSRFVQSADESSDAKPSPSGLLKIYREFTKGYSGCSLRREEYFKGFIEEYSMPGAYLAVTPSACCAGWFEGEGRFTATELFFLPGRLNEAIALLPRDAASLSFALPTGLGFMREEEDGSVPGFKASRREPYCMLAPLSEGFSLGAEECYCMDRY